MGEKYATLFIKLITKISETETVQYVLAMIEQLLNSEYWSM